MLMTVSEKNRITSLVIKKGKMSFQTVKRTKTSFSKKRIFWPQGMRPLRLIGPPDANAAEEKKRKAEEAARRAAALEDAAKKAAAAEAARQVEANAPILRVVHWNMLADGLAFDGFTTRMDVDVNKKSGKSGGVTTQVITQYTKLKEQLKILISEYAEKDHFNLVIQEHIKNTIIAAATNENKDPRSKTLKTLKDEIFQLKEKFLQALRYAFVLLVDSSQEEVRSKLNSLHDEEGYEFINELVSKWGLAARYHVNLASIEECQLCRDKLRLSYGPDRTIADNPTAAYRNATTITAAASAAAAAAAAAAAVAPYLKKMSAALLVMKELDKYIETFRRSENIDEILSVAKAQTTQMKFAGRVKDIAEYIIPDLDAPPDIITLVECDRPLLVVNALNNRAPSCNYTFYKGKKGKQSTVAAEEVFNINNFPKQYESVQKITEMDIAANPTKKYLNASTYRKYFNLEDVAFAPKINSNARIMPDSTETWTHRGDDGTVIIWNNAKLQAEEVELKYVESTRWEKRSTEFREYLKNEEKQAGATDAELTAFASDDAKDVTDLLKSQQYTSIIEDVHFGARVPDVKGGNRTFKPSGIVYVKLQWRLTGLDRRPIEVFATHLASGVKEGDVEERKRQMMHVKAMIDAKKGYVSRVGQKWKALGPGPQQKPLGLYFTEEAARAKLAQIASTPDAQRAAAAAANSWRILCMDGNTDFHDDDSASTREIKSILNEGFQGYLAQQNTYSTVKQRGFMSCQPHKMSSEGTVQNIDYVYYKGCEEEAAAMGADYDMGLPTKSNTAQPNVDDYMDHLIPSFVEGNVVPSDHYAIRVTLK